MRKKSKKKKKRVCCVIKAELARPDHELQSNKQSIYGFVGSHKSYPLESHGPGEWRGFGTALLPGLDNRDNSGGHVPQSHNGRRQHYGHDKLQNRQAAADHLELLFVQFGGGGFRGRPHLYAPLHGVYGAGLLAPGPPRLRRLAGTRLLGEQRFGAQFTHHQLR